MLSSCMDHFSKLVGNDQGIRFRDLGLGNGKWNAKHTWSMKCKRGPVQERVRFGFCSCLHGMEEIEWKRK